jgi:hypothetical protein
MDCKEARMLLEVAHPLATQLDAPETEALAAHLADCAECGSWAEAEHLVDEKLGAAMRDVPVPDGFQQRLLRRLQVERDAWWRVRLVRVAGVAAAVLLACWMGYVAWFGKKPIPDLEALLKDADQVPYNTNLVEQVFLAKGVVMTAPPTFDYRYLVSCNMVDFQGKQVPCLLFVRQDSGKLPVTAQVYVLSDRVFDIEAIRNSPPLPGSHQNINTLVDKNDSHVVYVVVYTAPSCEVFFKPAGTQF